MAPTAPLSPVRTDGRHLSVDGSPWRLKAVTYGSFLPRSGDGAAFPEPARVRGDLATAAAAGFNAVRTYTLPPADLLDAAEESGLRLLVGLHYDDWRMVDGTSRRASDRVRDSGRRAVDQALAALQGRRCVAAVVVGNEVPGDLVRVHGPRRVEAVLADLVARVHDGAPGLLATYANYPTTEYLGSTARTWPASTSSSTTRSPCAATCSTWRSARSCRWWCPSSASTRPAPARPSRPSSCRPSSTPSTRPAAPGRRSSRSPTSGASAASRWRAGSSACRTGCARRGRPSPSPPTGRSGRCASCGPPGRG
jgi:hypothetical protein